MVNGLQISGAFPLARARELTNTADKAGKVLEVLRKKRDLLASQLE